MVNWRLRIAAWGVLAAGFWPGPARAAADKADVKVPPAPRVVVQQFHDLLAKDDPQAAAKLIYPTPREARSVTEFLQEWAEEMKAGKADFEVLDEKADGPCAAVVINENIKHGRPTTDYDPVYLIRKDGRWQILFGPDYRDHGFDKGTLDRLELLQGWFELYKEKALKRQKQRR